MSFIELEERLLNIEGSIKDIFIVMLEYMEKNPKVDDQWLEMRLRTLEFQVKKIRERVGDNNAKG